MTTENTDHVCTCIAPGEPRWMIPEDCPYAFEMHNDNMFCTKKSHAKLFIVTAPEPIEIKTKLT